jgi:hypothetical protein
MSSIKRYSDHRLGLRTILSLWASGELFGVEPGPTHGAWTQLKELFSVLRTHPEGRLCGFRVGGWYIYVVLGALHIWRNGVHRYWMLRRPPELRMHPGSAHQRRGDQ